MAFVDIADLPGGIPLQRRGKCLRVPLLDIAAWGAIHNTPRTTGVIRVAYLLHSEYRKKKGRGNGEEPNPVLTRLVASVK